MGLRAVNLGWAPWTHSFCGIGPWVEDHGNDSLRQQLEAIEDADAALYKQAVDFFCVLPDAIESASIKPSDGLNIASFVDGLLYNAMSEETPYRKVDLAGALIRLIRVFGRPSVLLSVTRVQITLDTDVADILLEAIPNPAT